MGRHLPTPIGIAEVFNESFDTGYIQCNDWTNQLLGNSIGSNLVHGLDVNLNEIEVMIIVSEDGVTPKYFHSSSWTYFTADHAGWSIQQVNRNELSIRTGASGAPNFYNASGTAVAPSNGWYYRILVTKIQPSSRIINVNPSHFHRKFDTGWVSNSDWTNQLLGNTAGANLVHGLGANLAELNVQVLISTDGTDANAISIGAIPWSQYDSGATVYYERGVQASYVDNNTLTLRTGANGVTYYDGTGNTVILGAASAFYYRVIVRKWES